ncbi:MAG: hypothetical protein HQL30_00595 [Candidatus Omnitrophica bacterium]|nr:hypothetical protein [Candidatus Omnitrophota bacterium]
MKQLVYKTLEGNNPRKKEVSIQEIEDCAITQVKKEWTCKYFVKSTHVSRSEEDLNKWVSRNKKSDKNVKSCHLFKEIDTERNTTKVVCKVLGEFFAITGLTVIKIVYINSLKIFMSNTKGN